MKKLSLGLDSTLGNWIMLSSGTFGDDSGATKFLRDKAEKATNGLDEEVKTDEAQLLHVLMQLHRDTLHI
ncbi:hypothetical protein NSQ62_07990 [Solibacillus sp. FSL H8-0523]|uniref:hypothetical protein n=1 Tax=Solibacillus sp. FSL H8-0523 TaxID=2954511 RepID=UPI0031016F2A